MTETRYFSYSDLQAYSRCQEEWRLKHSPNVLPRGRGAAMIIGAANHEAIRMLHANPELDIPSLIESCVQEEVSSRPDIPVLWGEKQWSREGRTETAIRLIEMYWEANRDVKVVRSEVWIYTTIGGFPFRMRLDQIIDKGGELVIREIKTGGVDFKEEDLETDIQVPLQAIGVGTGYIDREDDRAYIGESDPLYHIHDFEPNGNYHKCKLCGIEAEKPEVFPAYMEYYNLMKLDRGKTEGKTKRSFGDPCVRIRIYEDRCRAMINDLAARIESVKNSERTGVYLAPVGTGFGSPCGGCYYTAHCTKKTCSIERSN